jgi:hypothetical protein
MLVVVDVERAALVVASAAEFLRRRTVSLTQLPLIYELDKNARNLLVSAVDADPAAAATSLA